MDATPSVDTVVPTGSDPVIARVREPLRGMPLRKPPAETLRPNYTSLPTISPDHYVVDAEIARGGMGRIRIARDRRLGRDVAIKEILVKTGDAARRFEREARITARLQHPSIVSVHEAGVWPSGEPFYAMKLVTGRSLEAVIAAAKTLDARLALLPNILAVADAMAYAHSEHVIHRDLKPKNVLVGEFGETVVIDWGLAKDLADTTTVDEPGGDGLVVGSDGWKTLGGVVIGTPAYMPPEQARGPVDERADVYAIGAILDQALSGQEPYPKANDGEILASLEQGPRVAFAKQQPGMPPDLLAIIDRAMAHDPAARYPTARELADDLRRYQTGQLVGAHRYSTRQLVRRWLRRHRGAAIVAGVALGVVLVLGAIALQRIIHAQELAEDQRARAEEQRVLAQTTRGHAEDLMGFMLVELRDKLKPLGRLDLLDDVAKKAVAYYDRNREQLSDAESGRHALGRENLGDVLFAQGHAEGALVQYRAALAVHEGLAAKSPTDTDRQRELMICHLRIGDVLFAQGNAEGALAEHRAALAISEALVASDPTHANRRRELAVSHTKVGDVVFAQGHAARALAEYRAAMAIEQSLAANEPDNLDRQEDLAISHNKVGNVVLAQGNATGALAEYRAYLAIAEAVAAKDPTNARRRRNVAVSHGKIGEVLSIQGDLAGALAEYKAYRAICEALAAGDPTNADNQVDLSVGHAKVGEALAAQGDTAGALAEFQASMAIARTLAANDPTNADRQAALAVSHNQVGSMLAARGNPAAALVEYRAYVAIADTLVTKDPTNAERQRDLSVAHQRVGDVLLSEHDVAGALTEFRATLAILDSLARTDPTNTDRQRDLSVGYEKVGDVLLARGDAAGALEHYRKDLAIAATLAAKDPTNAGWQADLAGSHEKMGDALRAQGNTAQARTEYTAGLELARRLQTKHPEDADLRALATGLAAKAAARRP